MQLTEKDIVWRSHWLRQALPEDPDLASARRGDAG